MSAPLVLTLLLNAPAEPPAAPLTGSPVAETEQPVEYDLKQLSPNVTVEVFTGKVKLSGANEYREALKTPSDGKTVVTSVAFVREAPPVEVIAAAAVLAAHNPTRVAAIENGFREKADAPADIRGLKVFNIGLTVVDSEERSAEEGGGTVLRVSPSYFVQTAKPWSQTGYAEAHDDEAEVWLVKDGKLTLLDGEVALKPFLFL